MIAVPSSFYTFSVNPWCPFFYAYVACCCIFSFGSHTQSSTLMQCHSWNHLYLHVSDHACLFHIDFWMRMWCKRAWLVKYLKRIRASLERTATACHDLRFCFNHFIVVVCKSSHRDVLVSSQVKSLKSGVCHNTRTYKKACRIMQSANCRRPSQTSVQCPDEELKRG